MRAHFFTLANQLTLLRLALIPFFVLAILEGNRALALGLFVAAGISDALDGLLARLLDQRTAFGAYFDPIADKLLLSSAFVILALEGLLPWTLAILVVGRDVLIVMIAGVIILATGYRPFPPSRLGKACTVVETATVFAVLVANVFLPRWLLGIRDFLFWLTAALVLASGVQYALRVGKMMPDLHAKN